jgi:hypothetical protein
MKVVGLACSILGGSGAFQAATRGAWVAWAGCFALALVGVALIETRIAKGPRGY